MRAGRRPGPGHGQQEIPGPSQNTPEESREQVVRTQKRFCVTNIILWKKNKINIQLLRYEIFVTTHNNNFYPFYMKTTPVVVAHI